jgi:hypothetical protein
MRERVVAVCVVVLLIADGIAAAALPQSSSPKGAADSPGAPVLPASTTTTGPPVGVSPLTGLPAYSVPVLDRPALSVKVDNAPDARPQAGLDDADIVTEELVEGGITRFLVTFQSHDAALVGPIRSVRPVDADLLDELGGGIFAFSGGSAGALAPVQQHSGATLVAPGAPLADFQRVPGRIAPANLFASTLSLYAAGGKLGGHRPPAPALFTYSPQPPAGATPVHAAGLAFSTSSSTAWDWNATKWVRTGDGVPATAADVVVLSVTTRPSGVRDIRGNENPLSVLTGSGRCWILRDGVMIQGTWQRPSTETPVQLVGADQTTMTLAPGRTWIELLPVPATPLFS